MKNKFMLAISCLSLFAALLATAPAQALSNRQFDRPEGMSDVEFQLNAEQKYARDDAEQEAIENAVDGEEEELGELKTCGNSLLGSLAVQNDIAKYPTTHTGAWHMATAVSASGNHVVLEDGSGWLVYPSDRSKTLDWYGDDVILVTMAPWSLWYSFYEYVLINTRTHARVYVGLEEKPDFFNEYTLWIKKIDRQKKRVVLSDNTVWAYTYSKIEKWVEGQKVLIGVRQPSFWYSHHNFLLNEDARDYLICECLY